MKPENVTTSQIIGGFTAKHWFAVITTAFAGIGAIAYGGFWVGQRVADSQALAQQADLKAINAQIQAKLEVAQAQLRSASTESAQMRELVERLQRTIADKSNEVSKLRVALGRSNNCAFLRQQIIETKKEMRGTGFFDASQEWQDEQKARKAALEQRLAGYQQQLGICNK